MQDKNCRINEILHNYCMLKFKNVNVRKALCNLTLNNPKVYTTFTTVN